MKLKIKLPLLFLLMFVFTIISIVLYAKRVNIPFAGIEAKEKYMTEYQQIAEGISALYPDLKEINEYLKQISENRNVSISLYDSDLTEEIISHRKSSNKTTLTDYWFPVKIEASGTIFFLEIERSIGIEDTLLNPEYIKILFPLPILISFIFIVLTIYFHFNLTKPIQILNARLKRMNIRHTSDPLSSKKKDEIGELYNHFNEMEGRLYLARKEQVDMIAAIAHDLKTPLTAINGFVELLATHSQLSETEKQEYYKLIQKKSKHIAELINDFIRFTKDELEIESSDMKPVDLLKLFENIAVEYEAELSGLDYELKWKHSFPPNLFLTINEHLIRRVFGNIFSNAVRYSDKKDLQVYMRGYTQEDYAYFEVEDNGAGVPDKDLSALFLKFFMVDKSRQSHTGGMGLGLASCKSVIEHHGGEICAFHSKYGGLGIRFTLPLAV